MREASTQGKKINGIKRHIMADTLGLLLVIVVHAANIPDRDGAKLVFEKAKNRFPRLQLIWADSGYAGIEEKDKFRRHWDARAKQLKIDYNKLSVIADGAHWIWDSALLEFGNVQECLDIYHALEHLSGTGKALYGAETPESKRGGKRRRWS